MRNLLFLALLLSACAARVPAPQSQDAQQKAIAERINKICNLPEAEREAELARLKNESGMVLYCGNK